jgi:transcriptional regulator with XRE-family HTH domain
LTRREEVALATISPALLAVADVHPVRAARALRGLSQAELEQKAGLPPTTVSKIENGARRLDPATRVRIAMALDVDAEALERG